MKKSWYGFVGAGLIAGGSYIVATGNILWQWAVGLSVSLLGAALLIKFMDRK